MLTQTTVSKKCHCQSPLEKASLRYKTRNCEVVVLSWSAGRKSAVSLSAGIARWYSVHCTAPRGTGISSVSCGGAVLRCSSILKSKWPRKEHCPWKYWPPSKFLESQSLEQENIKGRRDNHQPLPRKSDVAPICSMKCKQADNLMGLET